MRIAGTRTLLTGAAGGLGAAIARELSNAGAELVLSGRNAGALEALAAEVRGEVVVADLSSPAGVGKLLDGAGDVEVLVANAGLPADGVLESFDAEQIERALRVNLHAPIELARGLAPAMRERRAGALVFVSSLSGKQAAYGASVYSATKFGLRGFALSLREELREHGVGVSVVAPGFISDAGLFAESGVDLPPGVSTRSPQQVAEAVRGAIERDRAEVVVAPATLRAGAAIGGLWPSLSAAVMRRLGGRELSEAISSSEAHRRRR